MKTATHFIEQYANNPEYIGSFGENPKFTNPLPISCLYRQLSVTAQMKTFHTVAVFFITPKPQPCKIHI